MSAAVFHDHFKQLYGRLPTGKMGVLQRVEQQRVYTELDHEPTEEEILGGGAGEAWAGRGLKTGGPSDTGVAAAERRTLMADGGCREFVVAHTRWFWQPRANPQAHGCVHRAAKQRREKLV
jgi:hypothetical protein